jgi:uncharacterized protein
VNTRLAANDHLPLTCTRLGSCCHGKQIWINPWELARLAAARGEEARSFRDRDTVDGGIRLRCDGPAGWKNLPACSQYDPSRGCTVHTERPLACRLYPLGRERCGETVTYLHEGRDFPCLAGCPGVTALPRLSVADYLAGQDAAAGEAVQDAYLEVVAELGEGAFVVLFDSGLAASGDQRTLVAWRRVAAMAAGQRAAAIGVAWLERLILPNSTVGDGLAFVTAHHAALRSQAQAEFAALSSPQRLSDASAVLFAMALHLAQSLGADVQALALTWIATAQGRIASG